MSTATAGRLLVYGATGYTGRLIVARALALGLQPVLAGRDEATLRAQAAPLGLEHRVAALHRPTALDAMLHGMAVVLHAAGPFSHTALPMATACVRNGVHYLDVTGELPVFERLHALHDLAVACGVMLMPGVGFAVVPSDCLAADLAAHVASAQCLRIGLSRGDFVSPGSAQTMVEMIDAGVRVRRAGRIEAVRVGQLHHVFDFGRGPVQCTAISWPDVFTATHTTGIGNVATFAEVSVAEELVYQGGASLAPLLHTPLAQRWLETQARCAHWALQGPTRGMRRVIVVEVEDRSRRIRRARISTEDGYHFTAEAAVAAARRVLGGAYRAGFCTPAGVYGPDFVLDCAGVQREDLEA